jgi:hypothetical protein
MAKRRCSLANVEAGKATVGDLIAVYVARTKADSDLRAAFGRYRAAPGQT